MQGVDGLPWQQHPHKALLRVPPPPTTVSTYPVLHIHLSHHHLFLICPFFFFLLHLHFYFSDFLSFSFSCFLYLHSSNSPLLSFTKFPIFLCNSFLTSALLFPLFLSLLSNLSLFSSLLSWPPFIPYSLPPCFYPLAFPSSPLHFLFFALRFVSFLLCCFSLLPHLSYFPTSIILSLQYFSFP